MTPLSAAQTLAADFGQRVEHRLQIECRAADDFEHIRGRRLLIERIAQFLGALLLGFEQPHVLDGDDRLVGEGFDQLDLLVGEWLDGRACQRDHADRMSFAQQRHAQHGAEAADLLRFGPDVFRIGQTVREVNRARFQRGAPDKRPAARPDRVADDVLPVLFGKAVVGGQPIGAVVKAENEGAFRVAQLGRRIHERIENRRQIEGRAADDLEHVGGRGLLLQRLPQFVEQPRVLDGDDGLGGEIRQQLRSACR